MCYGDILYTNLICNLKKCQEIKKSNDAEKVAVKKKVLPICKASDTYAFGYKRDMCRNCGKEMFFPRKIKVEEKLCPICFEKEFPKEPEHEKAALESVAENITIQSPTKYVQCIDCGEWFEVNSNNYVTCRCPECQKDMKKISDAKKSKKYRDARKAG